jgi:drug/metabolite transporter (DMT)-like permease
MIPVLFLPLFAVLLNSISVVIDKAVLRRHSINPGVYCGWIFVATAILLSLSALFIPSPVLPQAMEWGNIGLLAASILLILTLNYLWYYAIKDEDLHEVQGLELIRNIPAMLFAAMLFPAERSIALIVLGALATAGIFSSHIHNRKITLHKRLIPLALFLVFLSPWNASLTRLLLNSWSPIALDIVRSLAVVVLFLPFLYRHRNFRWKEIALPLVVSAAASSAAWILVYYSYLASGVVETLLLLLVQPILVYGMSSFLLGERITRRQGIGFAIAITAIGASVFLR